ncbi:zinc-dependent alcohol dehydrogenase [Streptomyces albipurpureus]|uniref:2-deoxy-scyllo-inosamine dehydrogenase n=1 Tax=Streptomyces albipurpureus TaxID=2897419 RepID=A0ABT0UJM1_9ACTN|nr:alcohol dehydrogenase catalytic domain-containing protein [Streptomyces sp. CWNU-1]MCM2387608.1 alcohol dehydrogenase catalytic domain-containing protein [Streptomyces sp. CWNU-1]
MTFRASVLDRAGGTFDVREFERPEVPRDGALIRVEYTGVCATDLHIMLGHIPGYEYPSTLGHEVCGVVEEVGADFGGDVRGVPVSAGARVAVMPATPCGHCTACKAGSRYPDCENWDVVGFSNPDARPAGGGWGQYVLVNRRARLFVSEAPAVNVVLAEPASTPVEGLIRAGFRFGDSVLVQGTGTVGLLAIAAAAFGGASTVAAIGGPARRLEIARELGASTTVDIAGMRDPEARKAAVMAASPNGRGFDHVIECAGVPSTIPEGLGYLTRGGCYVELGHFSDVGPVEINPYHHILSRDARLVSSSGYTPDSFARAMTLVERLGDKARDLVTHVLPLERVGDAVSALQPANGWTLDGVEVGKIVIDPWKA